MANLFSMNTNPEGKPFGEQSYVLQVRLDEIVASIAEVDASQEV